MKTIQNLGASVDISDVKSIQILYDSGFRVFQFCISPFDKFTRISNLSLIVSKLNSYIKQLPTDIQLIVHTPVWYNFVKNDTLSQHTFSDCLNHLIVCSEIGVNKLVTHVGSYLSEKERSNGVYRDKNSCLLSWVNTSRNLIYKLNRYNVTLCFENTPGTRSNSYMGSIQEILYVINLINSPNISFCFDTQHAWANGESCINSSNVSISDFSLETVINNSSIIHLNANKFDISFGSHKDRHSDNLIENSSGIPTDLLISVLLSTKSPVILERGDLSVLIQDKQFIDSRI